MLLGSPVGTGGLGGVVFRDLGADNGKLDASDQLMAGFQVQAFAFGNPNGSRWPRGAATPRAPSDRRGWRRGSTPCGR